MNSMNYHPKIATMVALTTARISGEYIPSYIREGHGETFLLRAEDIVRVEPKTVLGDNGVYDALGAVVWYRHGDDATLRWQPVQEPPEAVAASVTRAGHVVA